MPTGRRSPIGCAPPASRDRVDRRRRCRRAATSSIVAGPATPLSPEEALALQTLVARGGGLLVAAASRPVDGQLARPGSRALLGNEGLGICRRDRDRSAARRARAARRAAGLRGLRRPPGQRRLPARAPDAVVRAARRAHLGLAKPLISASAASWGERDRTHRPQEDPDDLAGPVVLAAVGAIAAHRVIVVGSAESFATSLLAGGASAGDLWLAHAVRWLAGKPAPSVGVARARARSGQARDDRGPAPRGDRAVHRGASRWRGCCSAVACCCCAGGARDRVRARARRAVRARGRARRRRRDRRRPLDGSGRPGARPPRPREGPAARVAGPGRDPHRDRLEGRRHDARHRGDRRRAAHARGRALASPRRSARHDPHDARGRPRDARHRRYAARYRSDLARGRRHAAARRRLGRTRAGSRRARAARHASVRRREPVEPARRRRRPRLGASTHARRRAARRRRRGRGARGRARGRRGRGARRHRTRRERWSCSTPRSRRSAARARATPSWSRSRRASATAASRARSWAGSPRPHAPRRRSSAGRCGSRRRRRRSPTAPRSNLRSTPAIALAHALGTPAEVVASGTAGPELTHLAVAGPRGQHAELAIHPHDLVERTTDGALLHAAHADWLALQAPASAYVDPTRWSEDPSSVVSIGIAPGARQPGVTYRRGAVLGEWTPGGPLTAAELDALAAGLARVEARERRAGADRPHADGDARAARRRAGHALARARQRVRRPDRRRPGRVRAADLPGARARGSLRRDRRLREFRPGGRDSRYPCFGLTRSSGDGRVAGGGPPAGAAPGAPGGSSIVGRLPVLGDVLHLLVDEQAVGVALAVRRRRLERARDLDLVADRVRPADRSSSDPSRSARSGPAGSRSGFLMRSISSLLYGRGTSTTHRLFSTGVVLSYRRCRTSRARTASDPRRSASARPCRSLRACAPPSGSRKPT